MDNNLSIEQLALLVNQKLSLSLQSNDKRYSAELTPRRIRDYISQGLLDKPFKMGKNIYFTELHFNKLVALRTMQSEGLSDKYLKKISTISELTVKNEDEEKQLKALSIIEGIQNRNNSVFNKDNNFFSSAQHVINNDNTKLLKTLTKPSSKTWEEFTLDNEGKYILKIEVGATISDKQTLLNNIKTILNL